MPSINKMVCINIYFYGKFTKKGSAIEIVKEKA